MVKLKAKPPIEICMMAEENNLKASNGVSPVGFSQVTMPMGIPKIFKDARRGHARSKGQVLIQVIVFGSIAVYVLGSFASWVTINVRVSRQTFNRGQALQAAEAGIDYYRWHLAHSPTDFQDGTGGPGPHVHDFRDKDGNIIGQFSLDIIPPPLGSTLATVKSTGSIIGDTALLRKIAVQFAKPSIAK